ncbi:D-alanyl-D-alanine carboxypeptidase/D-alanyl-D-alanine-endopeptidase [Gaiella sp.]|uniref:D-alanyl-D-alanine carboxypeptidase/D-alanyl-D-alanine endopeptidase n=1 Tax=Gaiella sp. TaxID=2663207 RepID=UPI003983637E
MRIRVCLAALAVAFVLGAAATALGANGLEPRLTKALTGTSLSLGKTAALAIDMSNGETIYAHNSDVPLAPASNEKIPVSFAALTRLGTGYRFHTEVYGVGRRAGSAWDGDLVLKGFGDPTLASADIDRLAATIRGRGIRSVTGRILGDETFYDSRRAVAGWKSTFLLRETPPLSALIVDRAQGWPALSPPLLAARALRDALGRRGVVVAGRPGLGVAPAAATTLASDTSDPLAGVVKHMNQESDNFYAEMLLKQLPAAAGQAGTSAGGGKIVIATMRAAGIPVAGVRIVDGSGLSSLDRLTAAALVGVLRAGATDPSIARAFVDSLAVSGNSGTLGDRLPALRGVVKGKTGTTNLACTLSGLIGAKIVFAVLQNGNPVPSWAARGAQDRFVTILAATTPIG